MPVLSDNICFKTSRSRFCWRLFLVMALFSAFFGQEVRAAAKAEIRDIVVNNSSEDLLLYMVVDKAFRQEMEEGIYNGIPASFTFFVSLREVADGRPGKQLTSLEFDRVLSYDSLKEVFNLHFSENNTALTVTSLAEAEALMTEVNGVKITGLAQIKPGSKYFLSVKVRLERKTLPLFFHYLIPFWQLRDEETDWHYVEFRY
ncbi:MAG: DUF4390 domain-containing protein [Desulfobulbaceae bacterium]|nr:DUF4390 domain-containing protein [Desulfobulbaceae bacterium]